jgi:hypothetical protein
MLAKNPNWRLFLQAQTAGVLHTAAVTIEGRVRRPWCVMPADLAPDRVLLVATINIHKGRMLGRVTLVE